MAKEYPLLTDVEWHPDWAFDAEPISKASFVLAYAEQHPFRQCLHATETWDALHCRKLSTFGGHVEIDEDPVSAVPS
jgi:hypothetical protein